MLDRLISIWVWGFVCVVAPIMFPVAVLIRALTGVFDKRLRVLHQFTNFWGSLYSWFSPYWTVKVAGREHCQRGRAYVMVSNHRSIVDILVMHRMFLHFKWVSKAQNFRLPFIGWKIRLNDYVPLLRGDRESVLKMLAHARRHLVAGSSILMFPEGRRSDDGVMRPFKPGAFQLAIETGLPVLPILLQGTSEALPARGFVLQGRHAIKVTILEPVAPPAEGTETHEAFAARIRGLLLEADRGLA